MHTAEGGAFRYRAVYPREATRRRLARRLVDTAFGGSVGGLVLALLNDQELTREEADQIRALIDRAEQDQP